MHAAHQRQLQQESDWPLLAIDAGNTRIKFALFDRWSAAAAQELPTYRNFIAIPCEPPMAWEAVLSLYGREAPASILMTGSNPRAIAAMLETLPTHWGRPEVISDRLRFPIKIAVDFPERVGIDRLLTAVAANALRQPGQPEIIVDSGTTITVNLVSAQGDFQGGAIFPGLRMGARALHHYTALLPEVSRQELEISPPPPVGHNTLSALRAGLYWSHVGGIRELVERISAPLAHPQPLFLLTGGAAPLLSPHFPQALHHHPSPPLRLDCPGERFPDGPAPVCPRPVL